MACRLVLRGDAVAQFAVPIPVDQIPVVARRMIDSFLLPGGELLFAGRVVGPGIDAYQVVKRFGKNQRRSVLLNSAGEVLGRSHEIPVAGSSPAARAKVAGLALGVPLRAEVVSGEAGTVDRYRFELRDAAGRRWTVSCLENGEDLRRGRVLNTEVTVW